MALFSLLVLPLAAAGMAATPPSSLWGPLEPGGYGVGFERIEARDDSRARSVPISIWYPARPAAGATAVPFGRYLDDANDREGLRARLESYRFDVSIEELETLLATATAAVENAPRARGPFPLIVFGTGLTAPSYLNTVLSEYLASHGYVSAAIPSLPARADVAPDYDLVAIEAQVGDLELVIDEMHDYAELATDRLGLVAWSFGGVSQALLAMKNESVRAVVSLDAATGYAYGKTLLESSPWYRPENATAAFLHLTDSRQSGAVEKSFRYFDEVCRGFSVLAMLEGATHAQFTSLGSLVGHAVRTDESTPVLFARYRLLSIYVRTFLDAALREDEAASAFLSVEPAVHGLEGIVLARKP